MAALRRVVRSSGMYRSLAINFHKSHTSVLKRTPRINMCGNVAGVHSFPSPEIKNEKAARTFIVTLDDRSRRLLYQEMQTFEQERSANEGDESTAKGEVSQNVLWNVFVFNSIPFVGFGLLDNLIMIVAGEYIDAYVGAALGISTMAAAGLGNLVSDVAGVGTAGYVEALTAKTGIYVPNLSPEQASNKKTRWAIALGRAVGISVGCFIGMFPLLFFKGREKSPEEKEKEEKEKEKTAAESSSSQNRTVDEKTAS